jgi:hypothetical protein
LQGRKHEAPQASMSAHPVRVEGCSEATINDGLKHIHVGRGGQWPQSIRFDVGINGRDYVETGAIAIFEKKVAQEDVSSCCGVPITCMIVCLSVMVREEDRHHQ